MGLSTLQHRTLTANVVAVAAAVAAVAMLASGVASQLNTGKSFLRCAFNNATMPYAKDENRTEDCRAHDLGSNERPAFCYVLYQNKSGSAELEVTLRGCWTGGEHECVQRAAVSEHNSACYRKGTDSDLLFCCCLDLMCNKDLVPLAPVEPTDEIRSVLLDPKIAGDTPRNSNTNTATWPIIWKIAIPVPFVGLMLIVIMFVRWCSDRKGGHLAAAHQFGYDNEFEKSSSEVVSPMLPLDGITLVQPAAQGRFGAVWRGMHHEMPVAVKIFPAGERQSWERELEVYQLPQMQHANVLRFIGTCTTANAQTGLAEYWLLTSWHQLGSLYDFLRFHSVCYSQLLHLSDSIAKGVMHLHTEASPTKHEAYKPAMAHRDIKSKNIILKDDRTACIADFGLSIIFEPGASIGETHGQVGTRRYMSPEVLEGAISFDQEAFQRIDIYAVSLTLWEILSRTTDCDPFPEYKLPFEDQVGQHPSLEDMQDTVVHRKLRPSIRPSWREDPKLALFVSTLEECWDADADARLNACTVHERIQQLIANQWVVDIVDSEKAALLPQVPPVVCENGVANGVAHYGPPVHKPQQQQLQQLQQQQQQQQQQKQQQQQQPQELLPQQHQPNGNMAV